METNEVLNDLVKINNDRIAGYEKAIDETASMDIDLKAMFKGMIEQSLLYKQELSQMIENNGGTVEDDTTSSGKIYRAWMDIKSSLTENGRHSILTSCEFGEDAAQRAYNAALSPGLLLNADVRKIVEDEKNALKKSHDMIKIQCDAHLLMQK